MSRIGQRQRRKHGGQGFVLLVVIVMIAVATLILARLSSASLRLASTAVAEERLMRQSWAETSLRRHCLNSAETLLSESVGIASGNAEAGVIWKDVELADHKWRVMISDESSKLNLRHFATSFDSHTVADAIESLQVSGLPVHARQSEDGSIQSDSHRWDEWLETTDIEPGARIRSSDGKLIAEATQSITLWGDGRLNVIRCAPQTLDYLWRNLFGRNAPSKLHDLHGQTPSPTANQTLSMLGLRDSDLAVAREWVGTRSHCFSVWIFPQTKRQSNVSFFVEWGAGTSVRDRRGYQY